jgi:hypothetical protein
MMLRATIEADAWPSAQAFASMPKSATAPSFITRSTVISEPQTRLTFFAVASGAASLRAGGIAAAASRIRSL